MTATTIETELQCLLKLERNHVTLIQAAPGAGKTRAVADLLTKSPGLSAVILSPTRELARQTAAQIPGSHLLIDEGDCIRSKELYDLYRRNVRDRRYVCDDCPARSGCRVLGRYKGVTTKRVIISTHQQLRWLFPLLVKYEGGPGGERNLVVIDEEPLQALLAPEDYALDEYLLFAAQLQHALGALPPDVVTFGNRLVGAQELTVIDAINQDFSFGEAERLAWASMLKTSLDASKVKDMLNFVEGAVQRGFLAVKRPGYHGVTTPPTIHPIFNDHPNTIILTATPMPEAEYSRVFPRSVITKRVVPTSRGILHLRHITSSNLAKGRVPQNQQPLIDMLNAIVELEGTSRKYALVTSKAYERLAAEALRSAGVNDLHTFHYGALEGLNSAEGADVCLILGVNQRPPEAIIGRYLWDMIDAGQMTGDDFCTLTTEGPVYPDSRLDAYNRHLNTSDVLQGLGRTRWVRQQTPVVCYLLSRRDHGLSGTAATYEVVESLIAPWSQAQAPGRPSEMDRVVHVAVSVVQQERKATVRRVAEASGLAKSTVSKYLKAFEVQQELLTHGILLVEDLSSGKRGRPARVLMHIDDYAPLRGLESATDGDDQCPQSSELQDPEASLGQNT